MKLATLRTAHGTRAVRLDGEVHVDLGYPDLGALFAEPDWRTKATATGPATPAEGADFAPVVPHPSKIVCVGHNYTNHIKEMGRELPTHPTLFTKFADTLLGAHDDIVKPPETDALDWEVELALVVGERVRRADEREAADAIAGFTVMNDISARDWQFRTIEWTQGKIWEATTPVGPYVVTPDEVGGVRPALRVETTVDGRVMQQDDTGTLLFDPVFLVRYISTVITLHPGDIIATGTPAGVGNARDPQVFLRPGQTVTTAIDGLGACVNKVTA
ncbi:MULTISPECIES: fumarylacetoacetate hydrolase family protein [unclassified Streptomyces]|uniref:fumarylacetoacetate hydrolase family protein n=1 Tax=unclassified Streptomyces TaxID=2593676 RepID=UPI001660B2F1|nr:MULTISPECIES: fumarylacetoacetate hydrolase family protein [unclassified Streptomyces]MBD0710917.1 2-hydroxyhepta-2,4-diene-1,7-dioate isomerase [Streptomyces sp. CBMA291]MBD0717336.1 2-hydroxyhepta-2,4-diene-1,7-dioate isomerase [Streptomyces sp. CBMA370]